MNTLNYFFVGDVHGRHDKLIGLLEYLDLPGEHDDARSASDCLIFVGDLIDNKDLAEVKQLDTLKLVKSLCDRGLAKCILGNHEFNAIGWWLRHSITNQPLRPHTADNRMQHEAFLNEIGEDSELHAEWIKWFISLPLFIDFGFVRVVHACWDAKVIERLQRYLNPDNSLKVEHVADAFNPEHELFRLCEVVLKGPEIALPHGYSFKDKNGKERSMIRARWWQSDAKTYRDFAQVQNNVRMQIPEIPLPACFTPAGMDVPVVIGHYSISGVPSLLSEKVICVDYNAALKDEPLICYQWVCGEELDFRHPHACYFSSPSLPNYAHGAENGLLLHLAMLPEKHDLSHIKADIFLSFRRGVDEIIWRHWDPANVNSLDDCRDEYEHYIDDISKMAWGSDWQAVAGYLLGLELALFGGNTDAGRCGRVASHLLELRKAWA